MRMLIMIELMFLKELILISDMKQVHQKRVVFFTIGITDDDDDYEFFLWHG